MNYHLAKIFKSKLTDAVYVDRLAGLVREVTKSSPIGDGKTVLKTFPVACDMDGDCTSDSVLRHLVPGGNPGEKLRSIIYFEDRGVVFSKKDAHYMEFISTLQLSCWLNLKTLKSADCENAITCSLSGLVAADMVGRISVSPFNNTPYSKIQVLKISEVEKSPTIFSKYSYDDRTSYLIYPYDYFALLIETKFAIAQSCLTGIEIQDADC